MKLNSYFVFVFTICINPISLSLSHLISHSTFYSINLTTNFHPLFHLLFHLIFLTTINHTTNHYHQWHRSDSSVEWSLLLVVGHGLCQDPHPDHRLGVGAPAYHVGVLLPRPARSRVRLPCRSVVRHQRHQWRESLQSVLDVVCCCCCVGCSVVVVWGVVVCDVVLLLFIGVPGVV